MELVRDMCGILFPPPETMFLIDGTIMMSSFYVMDIVAIYQSYVSLAQSMNFLIPI